MRNRRNTRKRNIVIETITNKNFIIICLMLLAIIFLSIAFIKYRNHQDKMLIAKQAEELAKQTEEIFSSMENTLKNPEENSEGVIKTTTVKIAAVGDILCQMDMINDAQTENGYDFSHMFTGINKFVNTADITVGTLETNFLNREFSGVKKYNSPIEFLKSVKESGINLVSLAHNHILDYGEEGLIETIAKIKEEEISITGIKEEEFTGTIKEIRGIKIAFLGYTYGLSNEMELSEETKKKANIYTEELAKKDIEYAKNNSNYIIVIMHWGDVNNSEITDYQREITGFLVENGIDMILGSHPSVVEPMEIIQNNEGKNILVAYSLGNYISSLKYENSDVEIILNIQISKSTDSDKAILEKVDYTPIYVLDNGKNSENRFELIDMKQFALDYANGDTSKITRKTYDELVKKLNFLQNVINNK